MANTLDHFMWAGPDLDHATQWFHEMSGVQPAVGGSHPSHGTRNTLASLGDRVYLEIIAPDPAQQTTSTLRANFESLARPAIQAMIFATSDLAAVRQAYADAGIGADVVEMSRETPGGEVIHWGMTFPEETELGYFAPYFIDWRDTPHPGTTTPTGCSLIDFEVGHPDADRIGGLWHALDIGLAVERADAAFVRAALQTPNGRLILTGPA
ncbi:MAG: VOC family protein [Minwuiales bacterium]|nr:VOC family protein [Minwuiales bacterium]